jgi:phenylalanyl-tRNA synthetase beta chain
MKISGRWLRDYVDIDMSDEQLAEHLTLTGTEISGITSLRSNLAGVVVGQVLTKEKHPRADRLSVCRVDVGSEVLDIICGAPNVAAGQKVPVAMVGTVLPGDFRIEARTIRGIMSQGMICSEKELDISEEAAGIMVLNDDLALGKPLPEVLPLDDVVLDADLTPNRPDCLSMVGMAREVAAITGKRFRPPVVEPPGRPQEGVRKESARRIPVTLHDPLGCPRYSAQLVSGVKIAPSPVWLSRRLLAAGIRSINNVVDVTNYVMLELGQPLHAFDYDLLRGGQIHVRRARAGESFTTLDEKQHTLNDEILLICDDERPVALAGIMGGLESEVRPETVNLLLESAYFEPTVIRRGSKALNISTESSQRFERGVDPNGVVVASHRAVGLILELAGGELVGELTDEYPRSLSPVTIALRVERVNQLLGTKLTSQEIRGYLESLGMEVGPEASGSKAMAVTVPTFRPDVTREVDLVEEVARIYGYERIPATVHAGGSLKVSQDRKDRALQRLRTALCGLGFQEVVCNSLTDPKLLKALSYPEEPRAILNPLSDDLSVLRPSLVPGLLQVFAHNRRRALRDLRIFEVGKIFRQPPDGQVTDERWSLCGLLSGRRQIRFWGEKGREVDFFDLKGLVESILQKLSIDKFHFLPYDEGGFFRPGHAAALMLGDKGCGLVGQLASSVLQVFDLENAAFVFDLDVATLMEVMEGARQYCELPKFPPADRDMAIVLPQEVPAADVERVIREGGGGLVVEVELFDVYRGKQIASGKKGLAFSLRYQSAEKTLTDDEIEDVQRRILTGLQERFGAQLRVE